MGDSIVFNDVNFSYHSNDLSHQALKDINLKIPYHSFTAIVGKTGSGKSTLVQQINGLLKPTSGTVMVGNSIISNKTPDKKLFKLRKKVGIVFQFPEHQLFEDTVLKDVCFGPKNIGYNDNDVMTLAEKSLQVVDFPKRLYDQSPFNLSGGQMRRVAIAGVLAMNPKILILDEPTAGLDQIGKRSIMNLIYNLYCKRNLTIIMVTHQMSDVSDYADHVIVMNNGKMVKMTTPRLLFENYNLVLHNNLRMPEVVNFAYHLKQNGVSFSKIPLNIKELTTLIVNKLHR
ncbi:energy-coupling factor transporter ATP-binding protein EcfA2 [Philodulcilactobacillus myokoensis]|uniref:Energy-coupling factor transporter ATP-binding protein EcfA2 n=1 Tax=Philodulcilactobacillus myokoensis TaxID=2929573 RepID=A0A9W6B1F1_9LACO|nr:energy-coupling factor transporter ATPase [Philodulcilactobacillus myokoensis]GLB46633.1 energy-coupling factor transporter ATP-binding protein EcfA2 [Philodulcilactobacillus myokoensis]